MIEELSQFTRETFDVDDVTRTATQLMHTENIKAYLVRQMDSPSDEFVKLLINASDANAKFTANATSTNAKNPLETARSLIAPPFWRRHAGDIGEQETSWSDVAGPHPTCGNRRTRLSTLQRVNEGENNCLRRGLIAAGLVAPGKRAQFMVGCGGSSPGDPRFTPSRPPCALTLHKNLPPS